MNNIYVECCNCREEFSIEEIDISTQLIPDDLSIEELEKFANETGTRFDCPKCGDPVYLSDCSLF